MNKSFGFVVVVLIVLVVGAGGAAYYFYSQQNALSRVIADLKENPQKIAQEEAKELVNQVGKLIVLPQDETPTIATVNEPERLQGQAFFAQAKKGDKVLIYTTARKAILFDPVANKILEVAPVNIGESTALPRPQPAPAPEPTPEPQIETP